MLHPFSPRMREAEAAETTPQFFDSLQTDEHYAAEDDMIEAEIGER